MARLVCVIYATGVSVYKGICSSRIRGGINNHHPLPPLPGGDLHFVVVGPHQLAIYAKTAQRLSERVAKAESTPALVKFILDTRHGDTQHGNAQHDDARNGITWLGDTQHADTRHDDTRHGLLL